MPGGGPEEGAASVISAAGFAAAAKGSAAAAAARAAGPNSTEADRAAYRASRAASEAAEAVDRAVCGARSVAFRLNPVPKSYLGETVLEAARQTARAAVEAARHAKGSDASREELAWQSAWLRARLESGGLDPDPAST